MAVLRMYVWPAPTGGHAIALAVGVREARDLVGRQLYGDDWRKQWHIERVAVELQQLKETRFDWLVKDPTEVRQPGAWVALGGESGFV